MLRRLRSVLFVPGVRPDRFASAEASGADAVVFDLEDSVDPARKSEARTAIGEWLRSPAPAGAPRRLVRVNATTTPWFLDDLTFLRRLSSLDGVVLPKTRTANDVHAVAGNGMSTPPRALFPLLETSAGVLNAASIAGAHPAIEAVLFGAEDLTAELGVARTVDGDELIYARSHVSLAAASAGIDAIDAVFVDIAATDRLREDALRARALGFHGKMAIHPSQIPVIHAVFTPSPDEIARAQRIVAAFEAAQRDGHAVIRLDDQMIDAPIVARAKKVLKKVESTEKS
jgi:citrate lyase subunit beta / citryl-CoA lyase